MAKQNQGSKSFEESAEEKANKILELAHRTGLFDRYEGILAAMHDTDFADGPLKSNYNASKVGIYIGLDQLVSELNKHLEEQGKFSWTHIHGEKYIKEGYSLIWERKKTGFMGIGYEEQELCAKIEKWTDRRLDSTEIPLVGINLPVHVYDAEVYEVVKNFLFKYYEDEGIKDLESNLKVMEHCLPFPIIIPQYWIDL